MIPKKIHYCWFGRNPKPKLAEKCIKSWKKYCPDYEIIEWNEDNFDIASAPLYVRQAYEAKKWAFVTDYVRLQVVYENGGIYLDTDVELLKPLDKLLTYQAYFGFENTYVATGLGFGAQKGLPLLHELMNDYINIPFIKEDGGFDNVTCPVRNTLVFEKHGLRRENVTQILEDNICVFSMEYFCPLDWRTKKMNKTKSTYSIHWFSASWWDEQTRKADNERRKRERKQNRTEWWRFLPNRTAIKLLGNENYSKLKKILKG